MFSASTSLSRKMLDFTRLMLMRPTFSPQTFKVMILKVFRMRLLAIVKIIHGIFWIKVLVIYS